MPTLHFFDGTSKNVEYDKAMSIRKILDDDLGDWKPTPEQIAYAEKVESIQYKDLPSLKHKEQFIVREHDTKMDEIRNDPTLKGRDKFKAVVDRLRERQRGGV